MPSLASQMDMQYFGASPGVSSPSLGTTVMSPPCSPAGLSPVHQAQSTTPLLDQNAHSDPWGNRPAQAAEDLRMDQVISDSEEDEKFREKEEEEDDEKDFIFRPRGLVESPPGDLHMELQPSMAGAAHADHFGSLLSPREKEVEVEKAEEEINEDEDAGEDEEDEEQRRLGHQPSDDFQVGAFGGSAGWHGDDLLSGMESEDVSSSCASSRQQGVSDLSSTQHMALLDGTQSSDALVDSSLRGSEGDGGFMGSPNVETLANEEDEEEDEERMDDMDVSSERAEEQRHQREFQQQEQEEEEEQEEDEDVEMHSEGVTESGLESCENVDEDDFNDGERLDNLNRGAAQPALSPASAWGQNNPFSDPWAQPAAPPAAPTGIDEELLQNKQRKQESAKKQLHLEMSLY